MVRVGDMGRGQTVATGNRIAFLWHPERGPRWTRLALFGASLALAVLLVVGLTYDLRGLGYLGVFLASLAGGASMFVPLPTLTAIIAASVVLQPWAVGLLAGLGGALGEMSGYAIGCASHRLVKQPKIPGWITRAASKHMTSTVLAVSIIPNPFVDFVGLVAGRLCYPVGPFLAYTMLGKTLRATAIAYAAAWGIAFLR